MSEHEDDQRRVAALRQVVDFLKLHHGLNEEELGLSLVSTSDRTGSRSTVGSVFRVDPTTGKRKGAGFTNSLIQRLKEFVDQNGLRDSYMRSVYDYAFDDRLPDPTHPSSKGAKSGELKSPFLSVFPKFPIPSRTEMTRVSNDYAGLFLFARYRHHAAPNPETPIICGFSRVLPWSGQHPYLDFRSYIPRDKFDRTGGTNEYSGMFLPYRECLYQIGNEERGGHPVMVSFRDLQGPMEQRVALVLRKRLSDHLICGRVLYQRVDTSKETGILKKNADPVNFTFEDVNKTKLKKLGLGFLSEEQFEKHFAPFAVDEIRNSAPKDGGAALTDQF